MYLGYEICPTTLRRHVQGYVSFENPTSVRPLARLIQSGWIDVAKGTELQNRKYCLKGGDVLCDEGKASAICVETKERSWDEKAGELIEKLRTMQLQEFAFAYPAYWLKYCNQLTKTKEMLSCRELRTWDGKLKIKNYWLWGEPGTGKTRWAASIYPTGTLMKNQNKWWSGYSPEIKVVIIDDWAKDVRGMAGYLKTWADRYSFTGEVKQSSIVIYPGSYLLVVTSNYPIGECFDEEDARALRRRFTEVHIQSEIDIFLSEKPDLAILD